jgi:tetratricopeptide (TPR) repeat protein
MIGLGASLAVLQELRNLAATRQYWELERRLLSLPEEVLLEEPELGLHLANAWLHLRRTQAAIPLAKKLLKATQAARNESLSRRIHLFLSIYLAREGRLDAAERSVLQCMESGRWDEPTKFVAAANNSLGIIYSMRGQWEMAVPQLMRALAMYGQLGSRLGTASVSHNLGMVHRLRSYYEDSERCFLAASTYYATDGTVEEHVFSESERSLAILGLGDAKLAELMARRALERCRRINNVELLGEALRVVGTILREKGNIEEARKSLGEAYICARLNRNSQLKAEIHVESALLEYEDGRTALADTHFERANNYYRTIGAPALVQWLAKRVQALNQKMAAQL